MIAREGILKDLLLKAIQAIPGVTLHPHQTVSQIDTHNTEGVIVKTQDSIFHSDTLLIADGAHSASRELLGIPITVMPYRQTAIVASIRCEKAHQATAYQVFHPSGPLAFLPLMDKHQCSIVWSNEEAEATRLMALSDADFIQALESAFEGRLGALHLESRRIAFPLVMRHVQRYTGQNWAIFGDAAHTIHPLAGLGLNIGLEDIAVFLKYIDQYGWVPRSLSAYARDRKAQVWNMVIAMSVIKKAFEPTLPAIAKLRKYGLDFCNRSGFIKRFFIEQAMGDKAKRCWISTT